MIEAAYNFIRTTPPFKGWSLPPGEEVEFHATRHRDLDGKYEFGGKQHVITVSTALATDFTWMLQTVAHEMVHLSHQIKGLERRNPHGSVFLRHAKTVCRLNGWPLETFIGADNFKEMVQKQIKGIAMTPTPN
jgi:hypothetical protein